MAQHVVGLIELLGPASLQELPFMPMLLGSEKESVLCLFAPKARRSSQLVRLPSAVTR
jgi:hypothetical protein